MNCLTYWGVTIWYNMLCKQLSADLKPVYHPFLKSVGVKWDHIILPSLVKVKAGSIGQGRVAAHCVFASLFLVRFQVRKEKASCALVVQNHQKESLIIHQQDSSSLIPSQ